MAVNVEEFQIKLREAQFRSGGTGGDLQTNKSNYHLFFERVIE
jgi:hypothetical protein